ncbi:hypothetical protein GUITHDRAFT_148761 [Guillardia theta CCMP2712]|uniref:Uncharacterized protein n=1 Tax=Guillardia theta (strain CCMP2712) TaxID=905079 RepID=L1I853_GUITC|nr:hypothetical protein GUITHDRAFT_148761 [Guillardia theta CCMP2712]EKX32257.1 hypothetical protein GUITHDRAFT_148761 [Guillardia theta CCMP2712]|eukprot:XP_005819237.1 hypothetical protein GUITHDRAFT_148761 [Guillardia theta CCMP2712]
MVCQLLGFQTVEGEELSSVSFHSRKEVQQPLRRALLSWSEEDEDEDGGQRTQSLLQSDFGEPCKHHFNCKSYLICRSGTCSACEATHECQVRNSARQCFQNSSSSHFGWTESPYPFAVCKHKPLFFPFTTEDAWITVITFVTIALAAPTGTGGGGILVPMYMIIGHFSPHSAIPLSKATILGGAIANNLINIQRRHPFANRPLVDYDSLQILVPSLLIGTILGVFLNAVSPAWLVTLGLVVSLGYSFAIAAKKAWAIYVEEVLKSLPEREPLLGERKEQPAQHYSFDEDKLEPQLREIIKAESRHDFKAIGMIVISWILVAVCSLIKGGSGPNQFVACGSWSFWMVALLPFPIVMILSWRVGTSLNEKFESKKACGYRFAEGDAVWDVQHVRIFPFVSIIVGILAGALGGVEPCGERGDDGAHGSLHVLLDHHAVSLPRSAQARLRHLLHPRRTVAASIGNTAIHHVSRKYRKTWFVVAILAITIGLSAVLLGYVGYYRAIRSWLEGEDMGFRDICHSREDMLNPRAARPSQHSQGFR